MLSCSALTAQAQIFTNDKEFMIEVAGTVTAELLRDTPAGSKLSMYVSDANFNFTPKYTLETGMVAYSNLQVESSNGLSGLSEGYVGLDHKGFNFSAGRHSYASSNFGISKSFELGPDSSLGQTSGENVIKLMYKRKNFEVGASYDFEEALGDVSSFDVYLSGLLGDFDADLVVQIQNTNVTAETDSVFYFGYSAYYTLEKFFVGGSFSIDSTPNANMTAVELSGALNLSRRITVGGGYGTEIVEMGDTANIFYVNGEYLFHKEVAAFTEVGLNTTAGSNLGFVAGLTVNF